MWLRFPVFLTALVCATLSAAEPGRQSVALSIDPQPIRAALKAFGEQTGLQVLLRVEEVQNESLMAPAVSGRLTPQAALERLLEKSGLTYEFVNARTVRISRRVPDGRAMAREPGVDGIHLVRAGMDNDVAGVPAQAQQVMEDRQADEGAPAEASGEKGIPEILVKGKKSLNTDIKRTQDDVQPYVVFTAEDIEQSMATSLDHFLMARLPMNTSRFRANDVRGLPLTGNLSSVDLRGLGPNQTLILVNGRRQPGISTGADISQADINGIALSSVERIEILPSTAGGIYGGGATGGVINIILKSNYQGLEVRARYDGTSRGDAAERLLEASGGFSLEGGRTTVMLSGSYRDSSALLAGDRDFYQRGRQQLMRNNPAIFTGSTMPLGSTTNIRSTNNTPLVLAASGQSLGSSITHVPYGYAGPASDGGAALVANAGRYNLDIPGGPQGLGRGLTSAPQVSSARLNIRRHFTDRIETFLDASHSANDSTTDYYQTLQSATIQPNTPNNPFLQAIAVRFPSSDFSRNIQSFATSQARNVNAGIILTLPRGWTAQAEHGWSRSENDYIVNSNALALGNAVRNGSLGILRDVSVYPLNYTPYLPPVDATGRVPKPYAADLENTALRLAGPAFVLPAGPVTMSALLEQRQERVDSTIQSNYSTFSGQFTYSYSPPRKQTTASAYFELTAPLIAAANALPLVRGLEVQGSFRLDRTTLRTVADLSQGSFDLASPDGPIPPVDYMNSHVNARQYTLGLRYQPLEALALRVSNAVGVLPPSLDQVVPLFYEDLDWSFLTDPLRNEPLGIVPRVNQWGDPDLVPEKSNSWSAGAIFTPVSLPGLRLSVDYTLIRKTDEIANIDAQVILDRESAFPGRIRRAPLTVDDQMAGFTAGLIEYMNLGVANLAHTRVEAYDVHAGYRWNTRHGEFQADAMATRQTHLEKQLLSSEPMEEYAGFLDGPLKWRGNAGLTWRRGSWVLGWNMQYFDSYRVYSSVSSASTIAANIRNQGAASIPSQTYHDLSFRYRFDSVPRWGSMVSGSELLVGISNVLDTAPPLATYSGVAAGPFTSLAPFGDPRLRRYSITLKKEFGGQRLSSMAR